MNYLSWKIFVVGLLSPYDWHIIFKFSGCRILNIQCTVIRVSCLLLKLNILSILKELLLRQAGWLTNVKKMSSLELWDWKLTENGKFLPKWQEIENHIDPERLVTITCSCIKAKRSSCQCSRLGIGCITFFKCQRQCQYAPI